VGREIFVRACTIKRSLRIYYFMENEKESKLLKRIEAQEEKLNQIFTSVEKMRKYFLWTFWLTVIVFVIPLIAMVFVLPWFISSYTSTLSGAASADSSGNATNQVGELRNLLN
jgi:NADH:ubiquinone oxidoreductase subunit 3 (subunit A)